MKTREDVNKAIAQVLTTQFKKEAKEAFLIVKEAGYEVDKWDKKWHVRNRKVDRVVYIDRERWNYDKHYPEYVIWHSGGSSTLADLSKFDFVGCLDKPVNKVWREMRGYEHQNKFQAWSRKLKSARWSVKYHTDNIDSIQKHIEGLQKELMYHVKEQTRAEAELKQVRAELGLTK